MTYWEANNPMSLAKDTKRLKRIKIYFDCGTEDNYGFDVGTHELDEMLTKSGYPHETHLYPAGMAGNYAMLHTTESLLFHWKAFQRKMNERG